MATKTYAGQTVEVNDEGYMVDPSQWNKEIAVEIAKEDGIELTDKHFEVLEFLREANEKGETLTIRRVGKRQRQPSYRYLYRLSFCLL